MQRRIGLILGFMAITELGGAQADAPTLEFRGVVVSAEKTEVLLSDKAAGTMRWVVVGQTFSGYDVTGYIAEKSALTLTKDGQTLRLTMKGAVVAEETKLTPKALRNHLMSNLRQLGAAADQYYLEHGVTTAKLSDLVGPNTYIKTLYLVPGESYDGVVFAQGKPISVKLPDGIELTFDQ